MEDNKDQRSQRAGGRQRPGAERAADFKGSEREQNKQITVLTKQSAESEPVIDVRARRPRESESGDAEEQEITA